MHEQEKVVAFVGRSWIVYIGGFVLSVLVIWAAPFLTIIEVLPTAPGPIFAIGLVMGTALFGLWHLGFRRRLEVGEDGLVLSGKRGSRVVPWSDLVGIEPMLSWQWVRCRDASGSVTLHLTTSRSYPRMQHLVSRHNEELATRLWYASR
ncbi:PH domain-containing protein [Nocardioides sp. NPDC058538]|uniref:PH domain-containing protein n=1 Tax=Nocardioides sp. NPDC058538 TaxID=3346542 RepID=UPI00364694DA